VKLDYVEEWTDKRRANARFYQDLLEDLPQVRCPVDEPYERSVYHTFVVQAEDRDGLREHLSQNGIGTAVHYPIPIHLHKAAASLGYGVGSFPVTERQAGNILSLPVYPELEADQMEYLVITLQNYYKKGAR
jgi:dTDP-4-amino-4,6-dideoxygalactose transaminase